MNRKSFFIVIVVAALVVGATAFAQQHRPYNEIMKDVGATFPSLKKNLDANNGAAAAEDAAKLQKFFSETEAFWTPLNTQDAVGFSKRAQEVAAAIETAYHATGRYPRWWNGWRSAKPPRIWVCSETAILLRDPAPPAEGAVPGIPFLSTARAKELIVAYHLH